MRASIAPKGFKLTIWRSPTNIQLCIGLPTVETASFYVKGLILEKIFFLTEVRRKSIFCGKEGTSKTTHSTNTDFWGKRFHVHVQHQNKPSMRGGLAPRATYITTSLMNQKDALSPLAPDYADQIIN